MGILKHITMVGIDKNTDLDYLEKLQEKYPLAEFVVIISKKWYENGNRYWNPAELYRLRGRKLNLSVHLCGSVARSAIRDDWTPAMELCGKDFSLFKRAQLNIARSEENPDSLDLHVPDSLDEVIIQQKSVFETNLFMDYYTRTHDRKVSVLIDGSGGEGIQSDILILSIDGKVGYAGGLNPDNVGKTAKMILNCQKANDFWLDMESVVRTNDWFDVKKAEKILENVYAVV
jgi:hypothetical protein